MANVGHLTPEFDSAVLLGDFVNGSAEWHEARQGSLGGSQVGAALGLNPWESAYTLWLKLTGQIDSAIPTSMSMRLGTKLETPILEIFAEEHPELEVFTTGTYAHKTDSWKHANLDGLFRDDQGMGVIEVKYSADFWTEVPKHYEYQVRWYMHILGLQRGVIVALAGSSYREFWFDRDDFVEEAMLERLGEFWNCVKTQLQPAWDGSESTYQSMRQLNKNIVEDDVELGDLARELLVANVELADAKSAYNFWASQVLAQLGESRNGMLDGERVVYRQNSSTGTPFLKIAKGK